MIKAVLFDLDGTLLDRESSLQRFLFCQHDRLPALQHIPKPIYVSRFTELDAHGHVWKDSVYQALVSEFTITGENWQELLEDYESQFCDSSIAFPNLLSTFSALRDAGLALGIISNGRSKFQRGVIRALGVEGFLDALLISETEGVRKPEPEIFQRALQQLGVTPEESAFVGDHPVADMAGAKRIGMRAIWFRNTVWPPPESVDGTVDGLGELPRLINSFREDPVA